MILEVTIRGIHRKSVAVKEEDAKCDGWPASGTMVRVSDGHQHRTQVRCPQCSLGGKPLTEQSLAFGSQLKQAVRLGRQARGGAIKGTAAHGPMLLLAFPFSSLDHPYS